MTRTSEDSTDRARIYGVPLAVDFRNALVEGLLARHDDRDDPASFGRVTIIVNTGRFARRLREELSRQLPFLPQIETLDGFLARCSPFAGNDAQSAKLHDMLAIARLLREVEPALNEPKANTPEANTPEMDAGDPPPPIPRAPFLREHVFDLAFSLAELLDQCAERQIAPPRFEALELDEFAEHWKQAARIFAILAEYWRESGADHFVTRQGEAIDRLEAHWKMTPPPGPIYIAGSTGSRPLMRKLMRAVMQYAKGGIIVPSVDFSLFGDGAGQGELPPEHPLFGLGELQDELSKARGGSLPIALWAGEEREFGKVLGAAMAPAPYTDRWHKERAQIRAAIAADPVDLTYITPDNAHDEARMLAFIIARRVQAKRQVLLVSNDRNLIRRLTPHLRARKIAFDDSAGVPARELPLARFLDLALHAQINGGAGQNPGQGVSSDPVALIALLGHPLMAIGGDQAAHQRAKNWFERKVLREYSGSDPWEMAKRFEAGEEKEGAEHIARINKWAGLCDFVNHQGLTAHIRDHLALAASLAQWRPGAGFGEGAGQPPFDEPINAHEAALWHALEELGASKVDIGPLRRVEYARFWRAWISHQSAIVQPPPKDALLKITGHIEARSESADCVIFAAMNEGGWPAPIIPDMWLNRDIRRQIGLETPERFIGLAAHDYLSGFGAGELILSRAKNDEGTPSIESRFVTRLRVLLSGAAPDYWQGVEAKGQALLDASMDEALPLHDEQSRKRAPRPAPKLPVNLRPRRLSPSAIERLIANPYRYYAEAVLGLREIPRLASDQFNREIGNFAHRAFEFMAEGFQAGKTLGHDEYWQGFEAALREFCPRPAMENRLRARFARIEHDFLADEAGRREFAHKIKTETSIEFEAAIEGLMEGLKLVAKADRIDIDKEGKARLYDYKSGAAPYGGQSFKPEKARQLPIMAMMLGGEQGMEVSEIAALCYKPRAVSKPLICEIAKNYDPERFAEEFADFSEAIFAEEFCYFARYSAKGHDQAYHHLARYGEWHESDPIERIEVAG